MHISPRLCAIGRLISPGSRVADVGTDHGYLPVWLTQQGRCPFVIATDVATGPLDAARRSADQAGITSGIDFRLADGLDAVRPDEVDTIIIAGMGGETMAGILYRAPWLKSEPYRILLQPQSKVPELIDFLSEEGYCLLDQHVAIEGRRHYIIFEVTAWQA